jgi:hypothetical protein
MTQLHSILTAIEDHRRACVEHEYAEEPRQQAAYRLMAMRPQCLDGAIAFFGYLATLGDELEPGLAEMAAVCASNAQKVAQSQVIKGPSQWWSRPTSEDS